LSKRRGFFKGCVAWNRGIHLTDIHRKRISNSTMGVPKPWLRKPFTKEHIENISKSLKGIPKPEEQRRKM
jgi:hypothetical protein